MRNGYWAAALWASLGLLGCGGDVSMPPPAPWIHIPGSLAPSEPVPSPGRPSGPSTPADPGPGDPPPPPPTDIQAQLWTSVDSTGVQHRVVVSADLGFIGWWKQEHEAAPSSYGLYEGGLLPSSGVSGRFENGDTASIRLPDHQLAIVNFSLDAPQQGLSRLTLANDTQMLRADPLAHQALSMAQRSGRYAGELQLPGRREPVSLRWNDQGQISAVLTALPQADCVGTGQAQAMPGAPARALSMELSFAGTGCPSLSTGVNLAGATIRGAVDAGSADRFVLFGTDTHRQRSLLLPAMRVAEPDLKSAWTGTLDVDPRISFHFAVLEDLSFMGWAFNPDFAGAGPAHGILLGQLPPAVPGSSSFGGGTLNSWWPATPVTVPLPTPGFTGPLPVTEVMHGTFDSPATMHEVPIASQALSMAERTGLYGGDLQLPDLRLDARLQWAADGSLNLSMAALPACQLSGRAQALLGGPARWRSVEVSFSGTGCPVIAGSLPLAGVTVRGGIDAASGDRFVLFAIDAARRVPVVMDATRLP